jgi:hypothetical protein
MPDQVRHDEARRARWSRALASYRSAAARLRAYERRTSGAPWEEQEAIEEAHGALSDVAFAALRRVLKAPAPDVRALALKLDLVVEHEVATLDGGEACMAALRRDARRLAASASEAPKPSG